LTTWDVFHSDRLEVERGLDTAGVRAALARGDLRDDDLIRPGGTKDPWARLADVPDLFGPDPVPVDPAPAAAPPEDGGDLGGFRAGEPDVFGPDEDDEENEADTGEFRPEVAGPAVAYGEFDLSLHGHGGGVEAAGGSEARGGSAGDSEPAAGDDDPGAGAYDPQEEDEAAAGFTLSRGAADRVEELDLAAMVDVAFQLVLFFLVTATTVLYKSLEVPRPNPENSPAAAAQGKPKTLDDLKEVFILVEIDPSGGVKVDREPAPADAAALVARLREARDRTHRSAMLLSADFATPHRSAVLAYDAANEIGLSIAIARPPAAPGAGAPGGSP